MSNNTKKRINQDKKFKAIQDNHINKKVDTLYPKDHIKINNLENKVSSTQTWKNSKYLICPECKDNDKINNCIIRMSNNKIFLEECDNNHNIGNILLEDFRRYTNKFINETKIICQNCHIKELKFNNKFIKCNKCKKVFCQFCNEKHRNHNHTVINYDESNLLCDLHNENFLSYCKNCHKNLCFQCEVEHNEDHKLIKLINIIPKKGLKFDELEKSLKYFNQEIENFINILNKVKNNLNIYYNISKEIAYNFNNKNRNYQIVKSAKNIAEYNIEIVDEINKFKNNDRIDKFKFILKLYNNMTNQNTINNKEKNDNIKNLFNSRNEEMKNKISDDVNKTISFETSNENTNTIIKEENSESFISNLNSELYNNFNNFINLNENKISTKEIILKYNNNKNEEEISFLGDKFILNNIKKCELYYNGNKLDLQNSYNKEKYKFNNSLIEIKLKILSELTDMSYMFNDCFSLIEICDFDKIDTKKVTNMEFLFTSCKSLKNFPGISNWNTENVNNMKYMFGECYSLVHLPDISNWCTKNVVDMSYMFSDCKELEDVPNISKWDTSNVENMSGMFSGCTKLSKLIDLQKWDLKNVSNIIYMFKDCPSLPDKIIYSLNFNQSVNFYEYH